MAYVAPVHKATSIRNALRIRLSPPDVDGLVVAKANRLEVWRVDLQGMTCLHSRLVHGTISMLQRLQPKDSDRDLLFVGTERFQYFTLFWNAETSRLDTVANAIEDVAEMYMRKSTSQNKCLVDPTGKFMALHLWEGIMNVFRLPTRKGNTTKLDFLDQIRLSELYIKASTFIHSRTGHPKIAFLYKTQLDAEESWLAVYRLTKDDKGTDVSRFDPERDRDHSEKLADPYASMLIPVPVDDDERRYNVRHNEGARVHLGGLIAVGETLFTYVDSLTYCSVSSGMQDPRIYVSWAAIDGTNFILADDYGRLDLVSLTTSKETTGVVVTGIETSPILSGESPFLTSKATTLVNMGSGLIFLASHQGDSQLFRIEPLSHQAICLKVISNNAPILDFSIMDMGNRESDSQAGNAFSSGQARVVAGCGAYRDGSLRSIRSGVGLEDEGILDEIEDAKSLFSIKSHGASKIDTLIISLISETRVLQFSGDGGIEELASFQGMDLGTTTLFAGVLSDGHLIQITSRSVVVLDPESDVTVSRWQAPSDQVITAASANDKWAFVCADGITLISLNIHNNLEATEHHYQEESGEKSDQISCLYASRDRPDVGAVGWWTSGSVSIIRLDNLQALHGESLRQTKDSASTPRDVVLAQLHPVSVGGPTLVIAQEDGNVVTFDVPVEGYSLSGRKTVTLGNNPARLHVLPNADGTSNIFATTEHASLIYSSEGRLVYSATTADDATFVVPFDSEAFPDSIVLSTDHHLKISKVDRERLTHVKSLPVRETVRRITYSANLRAFGLGCIRRELKGNEEVVTSSFKLVDEIIFQELGSPFMLDASPTLELVECVIRAELSDSTGNSAERFIIGTSFVSDGQARGSQETVGRILVLGVNEKREPYQIMSHALKGACRCVKMIDDYIVAGLNKTVAVYKYEETTVATGKLHKIAAYRPAALPLDLDVRGNMIGVVDLMQSLTLLEFQPPAEGRDGKLVECARHMHSVWTTCVCNLDDDRWIEADADGNVIVMRYRRDAPDEHLRCRLETTSEMNIGEQINKIRKLNITPSESSIVSPRAFLGSIEGSLYLYGDISKQYQDLLLNFQDNLGKIITAPGNISFDSWRAFRNASHEGESPLRFVDGELLERFLDLDEGMQRQVCEGLGPNVEHMRNVVEELRRLQ